MALNNDISDFVIPAQNASLYNLIYYGVDGGRTGCNININGVDVQMGSGSTIEILVRTISGGAGCYLYGDYPDVFGGVNTPFVSNPIQILVDAFKNRVSNDGGTFVSETCLITDLTNLNNID